MARITTWEMATVLAVIHGRHSGTKDAIAKEIDPAADEVLVGNVKKALQALERRGFLFCDDKFDDHGPAWGSQGNRRRTGGKYANALWVCNYEPLPITTAQALTIIENAKGKNGTAAILAAGFATP